MFMYLIVLIVFIKKNILHMFRQTNFKITYDPSWKSIKNVVNFVIYKNR